MTGGGKAQVRCPYCGRILPRDKIEAHIALWHRHER